MGPENSDALAIDPSRMIGDAFREVLPLRWKRFPIGFGSPYSRRPQGQWITRKVSGHEGVGSTKVRRKKELSSGSGTIPLDLRMATIIGLCLCTIRQAEAYPWLSFR
jgi:hypothetical protein